MIDDNETNKVLKNTHKEDLLRQLINNQEIIMHFLKTSLQMVSVTHSELHQSRHDFL